jgi:hypothetical protein|tara:strand:- start:150 stop:332 length:183 start_codon:yes stop_codon:yes gene_type:complete
MTITKTYDIDPNTTAWDLLDFLKQFSAKLITLNPIPYGPGTSITISFPQTNQKSIENILK